MTPEGPSPELLAALGGAGPPQGGVVGPQGQPTPSGGPLEALRAAIEAMDSYRMAEQDEEDLAAAAKVIAAIQQIIAKQQKEQDAATGVSPAVKMMRRQGG